MIKVGLRCHTHPRYQAKREPKVECWDCKKLYMVTSMFKALGWANLDGLEVREVRE